MTILVTGATGFIGSRVVINLVKKNLPVVAADLDLGINKEKLESKYLKHKQNPRKVRRRAPAQARPGPPDHPYAETEGTFGTEDG